MIGTRRQQEWYFLKTKKNIKTNGKYQQYPIEGIKIGKELAVTDDLLRTTN